MAKWLLQKKFYLAAWGLVICFPALLWFDKLSGPEFVELSKWFFTTFVGLEALEASVKAITKKDINDE